MKNKIKTLIGSLLVGATAFMPMQTRAEEKPSTCLQLTGIATESGKPLSRAEVIMNGMPLTSDAYILGEHRGENDFYKFKGQIVPFNYKWLGLGIAGQHIDGTNFDAHQEAGAVLRFKGKPTEKSFTKLDFSYFPKTDIVDTYSFFSSPRIYADLLGTYNTETKSTMLRPGIDVKLGKNYSLGLEAKFSGEIDDLEQDYIGIRGKIKF